MGSYCDYKYSQIIRDGNSLRLIAYFLEGDYMEVTDPLTNEVTLQYVREDIIAEPVEVYFDYYPVSDEEINAELLELLNEIKGTRNVIPELQA